MINSLDILTIILLSVGLAIDCFAVSIAKAGACKRIHWGGIIFTAIMFGLFQGGMPIISYLIGYEFIDEIQGYDHWIALVILVCVGGNMIYEDLAGKKDENEDKNSNPYKFTTVLLLSIATSIDALASGLVFLTYPESIYLGASVIAIGSFILSLAGSLLGATIGNTFNFKFNMLGGIILICIGIKIVVEHCCM